MALAPGTRLGPYEITAAIGAGETRLGVTLMSQAGVEEGLACLRRAVAIEPRSYYSY